MMKPNASPPAPQPKQWKMPRFGLTVKDGVLSAWKGQSPFQCWPARFKFTTWPTSSTISSRARISSRIWGLKFISGRPQDRDGGARATFLESAGMVLGHERMHAQHVFHGLAERAGAFAVDDAHGSESREEGVVQIFFKEVTRLVTSSSDQVELTGDRRALRCLDARRCDASRHGDCLGRCDTERLQRDFHRQVPGSDGGGRSIDRQYLAFEPEMGDFYLIARRGGASAHFGGG